METEAVVVEEKVPEKPAHRPGRFQKGKKGGPGRGKGPPHVFGVPRQLVDMRHVYTRIASSDKSPGQKAYRKLFEDDPKTFLAQMERLERDQAERVKANVPVAGGTDGSVGTKPVGGLDRGTERAEGLIEALLKEWEADVA